MNGTARLFVGFAAAICAASPATGQVNVRTPEPRVTAENAPWYLSGEPVTFDGNIYYPTGPRVYFNRYEMVRTGDYRGVPLYSQTTIEPYSIVFLPVGQNLMQPYERRRTGQLAGTAGSRAPSFPLVLPSEEETLILPEAAAPPVRVGPLTAWAPARVRHGRRHSHRRRDARPRPSQPAGTGVMRTVERPEGLNAVYIQFDDHRYFSSGPPVLLGRDGFGRVGEYQGLPVYAREQDPRPVYVPVQRDAELLARYTRRDPQAP